MIIPLNGSFVKHRRLHRRVTHLVQPEWFDWKMISAVGIYFRNCVEVLARRVNWNNELYDLRNWVSLQRITNRMRVNVTCLEKKIDIYLGGKKIDRRPYRRIKYTNFKLVPTDPYDWVRHVTSVFDRENHIKTSERRTVFISIKTLKNYI